MISSSTFGLRGKSIAEGKIFWFSIVVESLTIIWTLNKVKLILFIGIFHKNLNFTMKSCKSKHKMLRKTTLSQHDHKFEIFYFVILK